MDDVYKYDDEDCFDAIILADHLVDHGQQHEKPKLDESKSGQTVFVKVK